MSLEGRHFRTVVYNAAANGKIDRVRIFLDPHRQSEKWINECLNDDYTDRYPLVIAARNGYKEVVDYLLNIGANPLVRGCVEFDNDNIQGTPALWAASAAGHLEIVKLLVEIANADVNQATNTQSTPLRGACYDGHLDIVKYLLEKGANPHIPNRHGHTCLMIAAYRNKIDIVEALLKTGIDVNTQTERGNAAIHDAAESGNVEIVKLLISAGAKMLKDIQGVDPLICAAQSGCPEVVDVLSENMPSAIQKRDALKLLGSTFLDKKMDAMSAMICWRKAMEVSLTKDEQKLVREMETFFEPQDVYDRLTEIHHDYDVEELDGNIEAQRMQSLIIRERILGGAHTDVHYYLRFRGAVYCDMGQMNKCYELWAHALELQQKHFTPLHHGCITTVQSFEDTFAISLNEFVIAHHVDRSLRVRFKWVQYVFNRVCLELERVHAWDGKPLLEDTECCGRDGCVHFTEESECKKLVVVAVKLINVLDRLSLPSANIDDDVEEKNVKLDVPRLVDVCEKLHVPILHHSLEETHSENSDMLSLPKAVVVEALLEMDLDVNATNRERDTALHVLLKARELRKSLFRAVLTRGALLFARNEKGVVVFEEMKRRNRETGFFTDMRLGRFMTLSGLAAHAIRVKYAEQFVGVEQQLSPEMAKFLLKH